jgi:hypothetical protein
MDEIDIVHGVLFFYPFASVRVLSQRLRIYVLQPGHLPLGVPQYGKLC